MKTASRVEFHNKIQKSLNTNTTNIVPHLSKLLIYRSLIAQQIFSSNTDERLEALENIYNDTNNLIIKLLNL